MGSLVIPLVGCRVSFSLSTTFSVNLLRHRFFFFIDILVVIAVIVVVVVVALLYSTRQAYG